MSFLDNFKELFPQPQDDKKYDEKLFRTSTDQLPPEMLGYSTTPLPTDDYLKLTHQNQQQQQQQRQQQSQQAPNIQSTQSSQPQAEVTVEKVQQRLHFDTLEASKELTYDISSGARPSLVQPHETRTNFDVHMLFDKVIDSFQNKYPEKFIPQLNFQIVPKIGTPFLCETERQDCFITPLSIATSPQLLRKVFRVLTPTFHEHEDKLFEVTNSLYFSDNRVSFVLSKALSEAVLGVQTPLTLIYLQLLRFFPKKYYKARLDKEVRTDSMAANTDLSIALGALEHNIKLHHFYTLYKFDIQQEDDSVFAADRSLNILSILEDKYGLPPMDALKRSLPRDAFLDDEPTPLLNAANDILETKYGFTQKQSQTQQLKQQSINGGV